MICSRFRHLNDSVQNLRTKGIQNAQKLQEIIEWFSANVRQILKFNKLFSLLMSCFFFTHVYSSIIELEDLIHGYDKDHVPIFICNLISNLYRICILVYLVKQTTDIGREAAGTALCVNEYCLLGEMSNSSAKFQHRVSLQKIS